MMSWFKRKEIPAIIVGFIGGLMIVQNFIKVDSLNLVLNEAKLYSSLLAGFAVILGGLTIILRNVKQLTVKDQSKWEPLYILTLMAIMIGVGLIFGSSDPRSLWFMDNLYTPVASSTNALCYFYIISAAIKLMRIRDGNSAVLLITALVVLIGNMSAGVALFPISGPLASWIIDTPQAGVTRAFIITVGLGSVIFGVRILLGRRVGVKGVGAEFSEGG